MFAVPLNRVSTASACALTFAVLCLAAAPAAAASAPVVASNGDAYVAHQATSDAWYIGGTNLELEIGFNTARLLVPQRLFNPATGRSWPLAAEADVTVTLGGEKISLGNAGATTLLSVTPRATSGGVQLDFVFEHRTLRARITRSYASYPGSPTIETWTRVDNTGGAPFEASELIGWQLTVPLGRVRWLGGLRGESADRIESGAFALDEWDLDAGDRLEIGSARRSTEQFIPFFIVDDGQDRFYGGIQWSAAWRLAFERRSDTLRIAALFPGVVTSVTTQQGLEVPHTFFGLTAQSAADESGALRNFIIQGIRGGRRFRPLVTYNTWFPFGVTITEALMVTEMDRAAALGVELFVMDAGWWVGAGTNSDSDYDTGLGSWQPDPDRFPSGLPSLADYAHNSGMLFGIWVEPARVALSTVEKPGLAREAWLATRNKDYGSQTNAQICLASEAAQQWVLAKLVELITTVRPDYLKWDNNFWLNCDRDGHGHGAADGAFAHTRGLYAILAELRRRFPDLLIENVSGGGNQLDFGMLAYTDTAWMDDKSGPSALVRHNLEGLTFAFPPAYLLSFLIDAEGEPIAAGDRFALYARSRMPGIFGLTYRSDRVDEETGAAIARHIEEYKRLRDVIADANGTLLSAQAPVEENGWDVMQDVGAGASSAIVFAFKATADDGRLLVRPRGLLAEATYDVQSLDAGALGSATGEALMDDGIEVIHSGGSQAHVLILTAR